MYFDKELTIFPSDKNLLWEKEGYLNVIAFNLVKEQFCFLFVEQTSWGFLAKVYAPLYLWLVKCSVSISLVT